MIESALFKIDKLMVGSKEKPILEIVHERRNLGVKPAKEKVGERATNQLTEASAGISAVLRTLVKT